MNRTAQPFSVRKSQLSLTALALALAASAAPALAQDDAGDKAKDDNVIIVTAQFREQNLQETPLAITAITGDALEERSQGKLSDITAQVPSLQQQLFRVIGQSVDRDQDHLGILVRRQANERIALFLHSLGERYRNVGQSDHQFQLPMSREDIARFLGLALETVSRGFTRLQDDGVIAVVPT